MSLMGIGFRLFYEWAAKGRNYEHFLAQFHKNETVTYRRMSNAANSTFNRKRAVHVIGIERWAAHRLRFLLGEPLVMDEYDGYAPGEALSMVELAEEFRTTRAATVALVHELQNKGISLDQKVKHNEAGDLTLGAWLFYMENHMGRETAFLTQATKDQTKAATKA